MVMTDTADDTLTPGYTIVQRAGAVLAIIALAGLVFILADVISGGKLTSDCGCKDKAADDDS